MADDDTLTLLTEDLPAFYDTEPYEQWLETSGGTEPITFEIESGEFPSGIGLSSEGMVYGTPVNATGDTTVFITVSDATFTQAFDCEVHERKDQESN